MASAASAGTSAAATPPVTCQQPLGTATVVEPDPASAATFQSVGLTSPTPMLRIMLSEFELFPGDRPGRDGVRADARRPRNG